MAKRLPAKQTEEKSGETGLSLLDPNAGLSKPEHLKVGGPTTPYLKFFSSKSENAQDVNVNLGRMETGEPYIVNGDELYKFKGLTFMIYDLYPYWSTFAKNEAGKWADLDVWLTPQDWKAKKSYDWIDKPVAVKEGIITLLLVLPGTKDLPGGLGDILPTVTTFKGAACKAAKNHYRAQQASEKVDWIRQSQAHADIAKAVGPKWRTVSTFNTKVLPSQKGFEYATQDADNSIISVAQIGALQRWEKDQEQQAKFREVVKSFDWRKSNLQSAAEETQPLGSA